MPAPWPVTLDGGRRGIARHARPDVDHHSEEMLVTVHLTETLRHAVPVDGEPMRMLPAEAYTSDEVLAWELRHLYAGSWTCLGREDELLPQPEDGKATTQRAVRAGDVSAMLVRDKQTVRMFANTCRHRGHELLPEGESSTASQLHVPLPRVELQALRRAHRGTRVQGPGGLRQGGPRAGRAARRRVGRLAVRPRPQPGGQRRRSRRSPSTWASSTGWSRRTAVPSCVSPTGTPTRSPRTGR